MAKHKRKARKMKKSKVKISREGQCCFCGNRNGLQLHHIIQKRFGGSDSKENLILICPKCHRVYHMLSDLNLNHVLRNRNIERHEIRETKIKPITVTPTKVVTQPVITPEKEVVEKTPIYISGGDVVINF